MIKIKTALIFFMSALLVFTSVQLTSFAQDEIPAQVDMDNGEISAEYADAVHTVINFNIMQESAFEIEEAVTRGEFAAIAVKLLGFNEIPTACNTVFSDVTSENIYSGAVDTLQKMGIVSGESGAAFSPDVPIKKTDAVKIIISILGYDVQAASYGGYPEGYLTQAGFLGLLKKTAAADETQLTHEVCAQLIYNALDIDLLQKLTYPEERYTTVEGENLMTKYLHITCVKGIVTANDVTALEGEALKDGYIKIDDSVFLNNTQIGAGLLGYPVEAYYRFDDAKSENAVVYVKQGKNIEEITIDADDVADNSTQELLCYYEGENNKNSKAKISADAVRIYNGKTVPAGTEVPYPQNGSVTIIDTNRDNIYDIINIENSEVYVVESISAQAGVIEDMYDMPDLRIDFSDSSLKCEVEKNGEPYSFSSIEKTNVLTVVRSLDNQYVKIKVSSKRIRDYIQGVSEDTVTIYNEDFPIVETSKERFKDLEVGVRTTIYFTDDEKAAAYGTVTIAGENYAYMFAGSYDNKGLANENEAQLRFFMQDGSFKTLKTSERFLYNGKKNDTNGERINGKYLIDNTLSVYNSEVGKNVFNHQLVRVTIDNEGKVSEIKTAKDNRVQANGTGLDCDGFSIDYSFHSDKSDNEYNMDSYRGGGDSYKYIQYKVMGFVNNRYIVKNSLGMNIPGKESFNELANGELTIADIEKFFSVFEPKNWADDFNVYYIDLYDADSDRKASLVVQQPYQGGSNETASATNEEFFVVDKLVKSVDKDGYPVNKLYGLYKGKAVAYNIDTDAAAFRLYSSNKLLDLKRADVIRVALNPANDITNIQKLFTFNGSASGAYLYLLNGDRFDEWESRTDPKNFDVTQSYPTVNLINQNRIPYYRATNSNWATSQRIIHAKYSNVIDNYNTEVSYGDGENAPCRKVICPGSTACKIYVYDEKSDTVRVGSIADIDPSNPRQTAVIRNRYSYAFDTLLINREKDHDAFAWVGTFK